MVETALRFVSESGFEAVRRQWIRERTVTEARRWRRLMLQREARAFDAMNGSAPRPGLCGIGR